MSLNHPGDLVLCIKQGTWFNIANGNPTAGPETGAVLTVKSVDVDSFLNFEGYRAKFNPTRFCRINLKAPTA